MKSREEPDGSFSLLSRERTKKGFQVAHITASGRESTYLTERLANGKERQVNKGCAGAGAIVALTEKNGDETITYPDGSTLIEEKQTDPRFGKLVPFTKRSTFKTPGGRKATVSTTRTVKFTDPDDPLSVETLTDTVDFNGRVSTTTYDTNLINALVKDNWSITDDPFVIKWGSRDMFVDLGASLLLAAEKEEVKIAVELKSFTSRSPMKDLENAVGQYIVYHDVLEKTNPERILYLAVDEEAYEGI